MAASSSQESSMWQRIASMFSAAPSSVDVELPLEKLVCKLPKAPNRGPYKPVVLVSCGSFNPPTVMHLRMFELAKDHLTQAGFNVLGGYLSPVNDAYDKPGLASAADRVAMAQAAVESSSLVMVDTWEAAQPGYQRSLHELQRIRTKLQDSFEAQAPACDSHVEREPTRVMLLCGSDLVESFMKPGRWKPDHLRAILDDHGVVCISRNAATLEELTQQEGSMLRHHQQGLVFVQEPIANDISASKIRDLIAQGKSVKYLLPDGVIDYMKRRNLYGMLP